jgi:amino acid transporter
MFTFTGYDASAHLAEETHDPARRTPWGILSSVVISAIFGYLLLAAITLATDGSPDPLTAMKHGLGAGPGKAAMSLALAAMWFCGLSSVTSASRTVYAFARDGGIPRALAAVDDRTRTPLRAIAAVTVIPFALVLATSLLSKAGLFDVMAKMATMALYVSYGVPIAYGAVARRRGKWQRPGPFHLRGYGVPVAWAAVVWCVFVLAVCSLPPNVDAAVMLGGVVVLLLVVYSVAVRARFTGPKVDLAELEAAN